MYDDVFIFGFSTNNVAPTECVVLILLGERVTHAFNCPKSRV